MADFFNEIEKNVNNYRLGPIMVRTACIVAAAPILIPAAHIVGAIWLLSGDD